jgi:hypothetical protein
MEVTTKQKAEALPGQLADLTDRVERLWNLVAHRRPEIPAERKYSYREAGVRLTTGRDPMHVPKEEWANCLSRKSVQRLTNDGDCPLRTLRLGGTRIITEASIQRYEEGVRNGWVDGYQVKKPQKYRK